MKKIILLLLIPLSFQLNAQVNYSEHIAPIIYNNCTSCHRAGEIAPIPFTNYQEVKDWAEMVAFVTELKYMPPWKPDKSYSTFFGEKGLTDDEIQLIQDWVDAGTPQGNPSMEPPLPNFPVGSQLGTPDLVLSMSEAFPVQANNQDAYQVFVLPTGQNVDREIAAIEFRPGNTKVVHHALIAFDENGEGAVLDAQTPEYGYHAFGDFGLNNIPELRGTYTPGIRALRYPQGIGSILPAGADILIQVHYAPITSEEMDQSSVNIFYKDSADPITREMNLEFVLPDILPGGFNSFFIPANQTKTFHGIQNSGPTDISLYSVYPHAHLLGKTWEIYAVTPDNVTIPMLKIDDWDFNWQGEYIFDKMKKIPANSQIHFIASYDNTASNPFNPSSPPQMAFWGEQTTNEMYVNIMSWLPYQDGDEDIVIGDNTTSITPPIGNDQYKFYPPFPNPANEEVRIGYYLSETSPVDIQIFDLQGKMVKEVLSNRNNAAGNHKVDFNVEDLSNGTYFIKLTGDDFSATQKLLKIK